MSGFRPIKIEGQRGLSDPCCCDEEGVDEEGVDNACVRGYRE